LGEDIEPEEEAKRGEAGREDAERYASGGGVEAEEERRKQNPKGGLRVAERKSAR
jgi:hypothetical protein